MIRKPVSIVGRAGTVIEVVKGPIRVEVINSSEVGARDDTQGSIRRSTCQPTCNSTVLFQELTFDFNRNLAWDH